MNYKYIYIIIFLFVTTCADQNFGSKKISNPQIVTKYSNQGFTLIYTDELFKKKIIFTLGLILLPFIFYPILAFGKSKINNEPGAKKVFKKKLKKK